MESAFTIRSIRIRNFEMNVNIKIRYGCFSLSFFEITHFSIPIESLNCSIFHIVAPKNACKINKFSAWVKSDGNFSIAAQMHNKKRNFSSQWKKTYWHNEPTSFSRSFSVSLLNWRSLVRSVGCIWSGLQCTRQTNPNDAIRPIAISAYGLSSPYFKCLKSFNSNPNSQTIP